MRKLSEIIVRYRKLILIGYLFAVIMSLLTLPWVEINYDNSRYLPSEMKTQQSLKVMQDAFGVDGSAQVMVKDVSIPEALEWKDKLSRVEGVRQVLWLDDVVDIRKPRHFIGESTLEPWYLDGHALMQVSFLEDDYSLQTEKALEEIRGMEPERIHLRGPAVNALSTRSIASTEVTQIMIWMIPILLLILILTTRSWLEPLLFMVTIGISVLINMGSNFIFPSISYLTQTVAGILQMAIAMDYSIFLLHRYQEERSQSSDAVESMKKAIRKTFSSISGSSLTTIACFVVLMLMRYRIGLDLGMVLVKGIVLSLLAVILLLPALTLLLDPWLEKTKHRPFFPSMSKVSKGILKMKGAVCILLFLLVIPSFLAQRSNDFLYGESAASVDLNTITGRDAYAMETVFGRFNPVVLMVPSGHISDEVQLASELQSLKGIHQVQGLATLVSPTIPRHMLPPSLVNHFEQKGLSRIVLLLDTPIESEEVFTLVEEIKEKAQYHYADDYHLLGASSSIADIKEVVEQDFVRINIISILAIALIIFLLFRSWIVPILLVFVIQSAIWINMAIPYFISQPLIFIGYMMVNTVQLGATIDYAILLTSRYKENRKTMEKNEAIDEALKTSSLSILSAAMILAAAGWCLALISAISGVSSIGLLIGRGAMISSLLVLLALPQLLLWSDRWILPSIITRKQSKEVLYEK